MRYFDHVATNPLNEEVLNAMLPYFKEEFGNPLSVYGLGQSAKQAVETARERVSALINCKPQEIIFTSSGAEANNMAVRGLAMARRNDGNHIIVSRVEHHSVLNSARALEKEGFIVTYLVPDKEGMVSIADIKKAINKDTVLISITHASSEIGTIEPISDIVKAAKERGVTVHADGVATTGNIPVDVNQLGVDAYSISAHQFYGPKGAGGLYLKRGQRILPLIYGGIQENGRRAGTENVPAIVGMGKAAEIAKTELASRMAHVRRLRDRLIDGLCKIEKVHLTGHKEQRLPGHASFVVEYIEGEGMLLMLEANDIYSASGSACTSKALKASPILLSMGYPSSVTHGSIVFSLGIDNTDEDIDQVIEQMPKIIKRLRDMSPFAKEGWGDMNKEEGHV